MTELSDVEIARSGPGGCPVLHDFRPLEPEQVEDPGPLLAVARREAPVFFAPEFDMYVVTRHEDARRVLAEYGTFVGIGLSEHEVPERARDVLPEGFLPHQPGMKAWGDPEQHVRMRKLAQKAFTRSAALSKAPRMRELFDSIIDEFVAEGRADLVPAYARRVPMQVVIAILGLDPSLEPKLHDWVADFMRLMGNPNLDQATLVELAHRQAEFYRWAEDLIQDRRRSPTDDGDLISDLIAARDDEGAPKLSDNEIFAIVLIAIIGGGDTSVILIGQIVRRALEDGGALWQRFLIDPDAIDRAIEEELRHSFIGRIISRRTTREVELGGITIPAGALVGLHLLVERPRRGGLRRPGAIRPRPGERREAPGLRPRHEVLHGRPARAGGDACRHRAAARTPAEPAARSRVRAPTTCVDRAPEPRGRPGRRMGCAR